MLTWYQGHFLQKWPWYLCIEVSYVFGFKLRPELMLQMQIPNSFTALFVFHRWPEVSNLATVPGPFSIATWVFWRVVCNRHHPAGFIWEIDHQHPTRPITHHWPRLCFFVLTRETGRRFLERPAINNLVRWIRSTILQVREQESVRVKGKPFRVG